MDIYTRSGIFIIINIVIYSSKYNPNPEKVRFLATKKGKTKYLFLNCDKREITVAGKGLYSTMQNANPEKE